MRWRNGLSADDPTGVGTLRFLAAALARVDDAPDAPALLEVALTDLVDFAGARGGQAWLVGSEDATLVATLGDEAAMLDTSRWTLPVGAAGAPRASFELLVGDDTAPTPELVATFDVFCDAVARALLRLEGPYAVSTPEPAAANGPTDELVAARNAAVAADRARTAFFAAVSHDLRTPIHQVLAATDQLQQQESGDSAGLLGTIHASAHELLERLDELLGLAKPPQQQNLHPVISNINNSLVHALSAYQRLFVGDRGTLDVRISPDLDQDVVVAKAGLLRLVDALFAEFMLVPDPSAVSVDFALVGASLRITVNGFDPPFESGAWDLVEQAVRAVGGTIDMPESGDALEILVPVAPIGLQRRGRGERVLLVDDTAVTRQLGQAMVASLGYEVDTADGGAAAISAVAETPYGLVLMDLRMPDLDGLSAARSIRAGDAGDGCAEVPIVALTAHAIAGAREEALLAGMDDFVTKPFSRGSLQRVLERFIDPQPDTPPAS